MIACPDEETRSPHDVKLERRVVNYLHQRLSDVAEFEIESRDGRVVLRGRVPSRSVQSRCIECCRAVAGVFDVIDRLVVVHPGNERPERKFSRSLNRST
jgi:hypothetical protein